MQTIIKAFKKFALRFQNTFAPSSPPFTHLPPPLFLFLHLFFILILLLLSFASHFSLPSLFLFSHLNFNILFFPRSLFLLFSSSSFLSPSAIFPLSFPLLLLFFLLIFSASSLLTSFSPLVCISRTISGKGSARQDLGGY